MKCWYCGEYCESGSIHMYQCAEKIVKFNKKKKFQGMLEEALTESMQVECPSQDCDYIMKGDFVDIIIESEKHFKRYHDNE
jgi:hypothetical protein